MVGIANHDDDYAIDANPYTVSGAYDTSDVYSSGVRARMYHEFCLYRIGDRFRISVDAWMAQKPHHAMMQRDVAKAMFEREEEQNQDISAKEAALRAEAESNRGKL